MRLGQQSYKTMQISKMDAELWLEVPGDIMYILYIGDIICTSGIKLLLMSQNNGNEWILIDSKWYQDI